MPAGNQPNAVWRKLAAADERRRARAMKIYNAGTLKTKRDYYNIAMLFQHGDLDAEYVFAKKCAKIAMDKGSEDAKWLYAATTDRLLRHQGKNKNLARSMCLDT